MINPSLSYETLEKMIQNNMEEKKKGIVFLSCLFYALAGVFFLLFIINIINFMDMTFSILTFLSPFGIVICFGIGSIFMNQYRFYKRISSVINEMKKNEKNDMKQLAILFRLPESTMTSIAKLSIEREILKDYEIISHWVVLKSLHLQESDLSTSKEDKKVAAPSFMKCPGCGASISRYDKTCSYCGTKIK